MKKMFKYLLMVMAAVLTVSVASCSSDDDMLDTEEEELFDNEECYVEMSINFGDGDEGIVTSPYGESHLNYFEEDDRSRFISLVDGKDYNFPFYLEIYISGNALKLKAGDVINDYSIMMHPGPSSNWCTSSDPIGQYNITGTIRVDKVSRKGVVLKFENLTVEDFHKPGEKDMEYNITGKVKFLYY